MSEALPSLRSMLITCASLLALVPLCTLLFDRPLALFLHEHANALVAPARSFTDTMTGIVQPSLPKWTHPLAIAIAGIGLMWRGGITLARPFWLTAAVLMATRVSVSALKGVFERVRPYDYIAQPELHDFFVAGNESFPSGHSAVYMGLLLPPALQLPRWRWPLLAFAAICALARVAEGDHYLADVTASALIALLFTLLFGRLLGLRFDGARA
jgi:membrane-associated phospholipid phosphatase